MKLIYNCILQGKFWNAGESIPNDIVPPSLSKYEAPDEEEPDIDDGEPTNLARKYGVNYRVDADGRMGRPIGRQIAEMEAQNSEQEYAEDIASAEPDSVVAEAIEEARESLSADVQKQIANARIAAERSDEMRNSAREEHDRDAESGEFDEMDVDDRRKPKRPVVFAKRKSFVKRNGQFAPASNVKLILDESLYRFRPRSFGVSAKYIAFAKVRSERKTSNE